jgi:two-component system chemotaxis response regulator CheY
MNNGCVAVVDDEPQLVRTYEILFRRRQIPLSFTAYDGPEAVEKFRKASPRPGVVIVDNRLPSMSGIEVMKSILAIDPGTKIVFVSGDESVRQESLDAGAAVFMKKPTPIAEISRTINELLGMVTASQ